MADAHPDPATPARPRRRWVRRLVVAAVALVVLVVASPLALSLPFVRGAVADRVGEALGREVEIGGAFAFWGKGIDLDDIVVKSPAGFHEPLAVVKHVHVDLDVLALIGGTVDAEVLVVEPRVAFARDEAGRSNADGLFGRETPRPAGETRPPAPREDGGSERRASSLALRVQVVDGVVRATWPSAPAAEELADLDALVDLARDGAFVATLSARAVGAAARGGDAQLRAHVGLDATGEGPLEIRVPALDLSRLGAIVEGVSGVRDLRGRLEVDVDARARPGGRVARKAEAQADGLVLRTPAGMRFAVQRVAANATVAETEGGTEGDVRVRVEHAELLDESGPTSRRFREPLVELLLKGRHVADEDLLLLSSGSLTAGDALTVTASKPWEIRTGAAPRAKGELVVQADLARLANLKGLVPALEPLQAGRVGARVVAEAGEGIDIGVGVRGVGLALAPGALSPAGHVEPEVVVQGRVLRAAGEGDVPWRVLLLGLQSRVATLRPAAGGRPLEVSFGGAGLGAHGEATLDVDLAALGSAVGGALGLGPRDAPAGTLALSPRAELEPGTGGTVSLTLAGRGVRLPDTWAQGAPPTAVDGEVRATVTERQADVALVRLAAFGLQADGEARLARGEGAGGLEGAQWKVRGDLAGARGLLVPLLGLPGDARLAGDLDHEARLAEADGTRSLTGKTVVQGLAWRDGRGRAVLEEPRLEVAHDVALPAAGAEPARYAVRRLEVVSKALAAHVEGTATRTAGALALAATLKVQGDAARLAGALRSAFGEDYEDLRGQGAIQGTLRLDGGLDHGGRTLLCDGALTPGTWSAGGLTFAGATLVVRRAAVEEPLRLVFGGGLNGGRLDLDLGVTLAEDARPFTLSLDASRVDTSPVVVDHGAGGYLTLFLPTLLPSDRSTPVLSGLLDTQVRLRAADLGGPRMEPTLAGNGFVKMDQGSIGESTLFRVAGSGQGLGQTGALLVRAVPEVGEALAGLSRSVTFRTMESQFTVANRVVNVTKGFLDGERTRIDFHGTVGFNEVVNLKVDVTLSGKAGERLQKVLSSKTVPLAVTGPMASPKVTPQVDAAKLAQGALEGLLPGDGKSPLDRLKDLVPR